MSHAVELFREYMGSGLIVFWFLLSLLYLYLKEKRKPLRVLFVYVPVIFLVLFFNPWFAKLLTGYMGDEIYYRILWLLPITEVLAYTAVSIGEKLSGTKRVGWVCAVVFLTIVSGKYIYSNIYYSEAENVYHMPDEVVHICDAIELPGREVTAVFPLELVQYVRQYSPVICMPYGREILAEGWNEWATWHELCDAMESDPADAALLGKLARDYGCIYIVLSEEKEIKGSLPKAGYEVFLKTDGYVVFRNEELITF